MKKHRFFIITFTLAIVIFFWKVILLRAGFLGGDYIDQCYPWSLIYAKAIKTFTFPYWTRYLQAGYPLMAEGQIGGFYPLNILFFFLLPFKIAYNYIVVVHFCLAGIFTYMLSRKLGACKWGGTISALLFCFGSAYAGCYINTATVKVLAWFPLVLLIFETYFTNRKIFLPIIAGIIFGAQLLAGSAQVAVYAGLFYLIYFFYGIHSSGKIKKKDFLSFFLIFFVSGIIFMPQFFLTKTIAELSWRKNSTMGFALWGSFSPISFLSSVIPYPFFRGARFYLSIFSLVFMFAGIMRVRAQKFLRPVIAVFFISIFCALGKFNPIYVLLLKLTHFYDFRNPSKFLLFALFAGSVLSGTGFTYFFNEKEESYARKALVFSSAWVGISTIMFFLSRAILLIFRDGIIRLGRFLVEKFVYGKGFHRYSLDTYYQKVETLYNGFIQSSRIDDPMVFVSVVFVFMSIALWVFLLRNKHLRYSSFLKPVFLFLIFSDLFVFSMYGTGFRGNIKNYDVLEPEKIHIFDLVQEDKSLFRILPFGIASGMLPNWTIPSANAIHKVDSVALYTPLANEYYKEALFDLEVVDCALGLKIPNEEAILDSIDLIRLLNVKYVISYRELKDPNFIYVLEEDGIFLYMVKDFLPRFFVSKDILLSDIVPDASIDIVRYASGYAEVKVNFPYEGYLMFSENRFPGWEVFVDGNKKDLLFVSVIQGVKINGGEHTVKFIYKAFGHKAKK